MKKITKKLNLKKEAIKLIDLDTIIGGWPKVTDHCYSYGCGGG